MSDKIEQLLNQKKAKSDKSSIESKSGVLDQKGDENNGEFLGNFNHGKYENKKPIYVDSDIHEVLIHIKNNSPFSLGDITSSILEKFVEENISDIQNLNKNNNKYLHHG